MEVKQSSKRLTAGDSLVDLRRNTFIKTLRTESQHQQSQTNMKHLLSIAVNLFCLISVSIVKPVCDRCNSVIYFIVTDGDEFV